MAVKKETKALSTKSEQPIEVSSKVESVLAAQFKKALEKTGGFNMFPTVSMQHGIKKPSFEIEGMDEARTLRCTIIESTIGREYREDKDEKRPTCYSIGGKNGSVLGKCSECGFGQWKEINGRNVKECKDHRKALLVLEDSDKVFEMKIPGTSVKNFDQFEREVASKHRTALGAALIELSLDIGTADGRKPWSILQLKFIEDIREGDPEYAAKVVAGLEEHAGFYKPTVTRNSSTTVTETKEKDEDDVEDADVVLGGGVEVGDDAIQF